MAWSTIRTLYAIPAQDLTVILGSGGTPNVGIQSGRGIAVQVDANTGDLLLHVTIDSGSVAITAAGALNQTGHTIMTMAAVGAFAELGAVQIGGVMIWRILSNDGVVLS